METVHFHRLLWLIRFTSLLCLVCDTSWTMGTTTRSGKRVAAALAAPKRRGAAAKPSTKQRTESPSPQTLEPSPSTTPSSKSSLLFTLNDPEAVLATLVQRPSKRNRSPYVADICLLPSKREAIAHVPNLDMGGKCAPGVTLLCKPARDRKGQLVGPDAVSPKFGTPKCEYIGQLLHVDESSLDTPKVSYKPTWVGAHPSLGERIAHELLLQGRLCPNATSIQREVNRVAGLDMRADFVVTEQDGTQRVIEVKTVVDTDYSTHATLPNRTKCVFTSSELPYTRTALFPWGQSKQVGPDGERVVSARAIKHVRELTRLVKTEKEYKATVLFIVIRGDAQAFRPNYESCPSFCRYLKEAEQAGVQILAKRVRWDVENHTVAQCLEDKVLDTLWPPELLDHRAHG